MSPIFHSMLLYTSSVSSVLIKAMNSFIPYPWCPFSVDNLILYMLYVRTSYMVLYVRENELYGHVCTWERVVWSCMYVRTSCMVMYVRENELYGPVCAWERVVWSCMYVRTSCMVMYVREKELYGPDVREN